MGRFRKLTWAVIVAILVDRPAFLPFRNIMTSGTWSHNQGMAHRGEDFAGLHHSQPPAKLRAGARIFPGVGCPDDLGRPECA